MPLQGRLSVGQERQLPSPSVIVKHIQKALDVMCVWSLILRKATLPY